VHTDGVGHTGKVSDALQNLMMQHGDVRTFLNHYLHRRVTADTAAIVRGLNPQESIMRSACTMSRWIDPNRPWGLTSEQAQSIDNDALMQSLLKERSQLKQRLPTEYTKHTLFKKLNKTITRERQRLRAALLAEIQERYEREEPVRVIEEQLAGIKIEKKPKVLSYFSDATSPEQRRLIETMILTPPGSTYEEEVKRRNNAIDAVAAYCEVEEGETPKRGRPRRPKTVAIKQEDTRSPQEMELEAAMLLVLKEERPKICFLCLGNESLPFEKRTYSFSTPGDLSKHFNRKHLSKVKKEERVKCNVCKILLYHKMHLQRHAFEIH